MAGEINQALADALKQALVDAHHETVDHAHEKVAEHRTNYMESMEGELAEAFRRLGLIDFDDPNCSEAANKLLAACKDPTHQTDFIITIFALFGAALSGSFAAAAGYNQRLTNDGLRLHGFAIPAPDAIASMNARGLLSDADAVEAMSYTGTKHPIMDATFRAGVTQLPPATVIDLVRRRKITQDEGRAILKLNGLSPESIEALLLAQIGPLDYGTAVAAVTQNQINMGEFADLLPQYGIEPKWAEIIFDSSGATMPPELAVRLFREGRMTVEQYEQVLLESNLKNKYVPFMRWLQFRPPPMEQTLRMLRNKLIDHAEAVDLLQKNGFEPRYAQLLADSAISHTTTSGKQLSPTDIIDLYEVGHWSQEQAQAQLMLLGYDSDEAYCKLFIADEVKAWSRKQRAANRIGTRYTGWKIDRTVASSQLDQVGIPTTQRDDLLDEWDAIRETTTAHLTRVDIKKAVKTEVITAGDGRNRLLAMGYSSSDVDVIEQIDAWGA